MKVNVEQLIALLSKFDPRSEVIFLPSPEAGDAEYELVGVDPWDVGASPGACAISITRTEEQLESPDQIATKMGDTAQFPIFKEGDKIVLTQDLDPVSAGTQGVISWADPNNSGSENDAYNLLFPTEIDDRTGQPGLEIVGMPAWFTKV